MPEASSTSAGGAVVRIVSGAGRYADPWHDFPGTSARIADVVRGLGHRVEMRDDVEPSLADLDGVDLVIVNIGNPAPNGGESEAIAAARDGLLAHVGSGRSLLAVHAAATSFPGLPEWEELLGGRWVDGISMHPPIGDTTITVAAGRHPITDGLPDIGVYDERYSYLRISGELTPLADHEHDGLRHPMVWARELGPARIVFDGLGHGVESYASAGRLELLRRELGWLLRASEE